MKHLIKKIENGLLPDITQLDSDERSWFKNISELNIKEIEQDYAEEYIFHSPKNIQIKLNAITLTETLNYTEHELSLCYQVMCIQNGITWNMQNPFVSFDYLGYRATLIHQSALKDSQHKLFLRVINKNVFHCSNFAFNLKKAQSIISQKKNVLVVGSTGSGKSSFINSLLSHCPEDEHIIIAEDTYELISPHEQTTRFIANPLSKNFSLASYMSYAMRMRPDRIIIGELRSHEVIPFLLAINSGHNGLLSTIHANDCRDAINRIALLYKIYSESDIPYSVILNLVTQNIDEVIFLKDKKVTEHVKVLGSNEKNIFLEEVSSDTIESEDYLSMNV